MNWNAQKTRIQADSTVWILCRSLLICVSGFAGYLEDGPARDHAPVHLLLIVTLLGIAFTLLFALSQSMGRTNVVWRAPHWSASPFRLGKPLQFPWFAGHFFVAGASGMLLAAFLRGYGDWKMVSLIFAFGLGLKLGVRLAYRIFRKRFAGIPPDQSA